MVFFLLENRDFLGFRMIFKVRLILHFFNFHFSHTEKMHRWCDRLLACLEWDKTVSLCPSLVKPKTVILVLFASLHTQLRRKSKDWLAGNQVNVSEWSDMSPMECFFFSELALFKIQLGAVMVVIVWLLDLQLPVQSMPSLSSLNLYFRLP